MNAKRISLALASLAVMSIGGVYAQVESGDAAGVTVQSVGAGCGTVLTAPTVLTQPAVVAPVVMTWPAVTNSAGCPAVLSYPRAYTGKEYWTYNDRCWPLGCAARGCGLGRWF